MKQKNADVTIIPSSDPHQSEYISDYWKYRKYLSGFTGSFGTLVIGLESAGYWTDSRYFLQAEKELEGSGIELFKLAIPGTPSIEEWIVAEKYKAVAIDGELFSTSEVIRLDTFFKSKNLQLITDFKPYDVVWKDRPNLPDAKLIDFDAELSGLAVSEKLEIVRGKIMSSNATCLIISSLDDIAWLYNFRGSDVKYNPVAIAYAIVTLKNAYLFVETSKIETAHRKKLEQEGVEVEDYYKFNVLTGELKNETVLFDMNRNNYESYQKIDKSCKIVETINPVTTLKAIKNPVETEGFRKAMIKDGVALTRLFMWVETQTSEKNDPDFNYPSEYDISKKASELRNDLGNYLSESFAPIVSFRENGAIVHYEPEEGRSSIVSGEGVLLMDLGAQFLEGTTDMTRTWYINGAPPKQYKQDFTALLKGVIALSKAVFPAGTRGTQLDILARKFIWERRTNYLHGTGHGVGHCLYVHEGPQSIRMNENPVTIEPGMIMSNEPALYRTGQYGIRNENIIRCYELEPGEFGRFFTFETLTLAPIDINSIDIEMMDKSEIDWLNNYHREVFEKLSPELNVIEAAWLSEKTKPI